MSKSNAKELWSASLSYDDMVTKHGGDQCCEGYKLATKGQGQGPNMVHPARILKISPSWYEDKSLKQSYSNVAQHVHILLVTSWDQCRGI